MRPDARQRGTARLLQPHAETYAGIALSTSAAHAANWITEAPTPQSTAMLWTCAFAMAFGFGWASYRLVRPRSGPGIGRGR